MKYIICIIICTFLIMYEQTVKAQTVTVNGNVFLTDQTSFDNIKINFNRVAPTTIHDSTYTTLDGSFSKVIATGIYNIIYSKSGYSTDSIIEQPIYSNTTLSDTTLVPGFQGNLSGIILPGTYVISGLTHIFSSDTLVIQPGVILLFKPGSQLNIDGLLLAVGTVTDSIIFTHSGTGTYWRGLSFNLGSDHNSRLSYCRVEYSNNSGIQIYYCNPKINHSLIRYNTMLTGNEGGGIYMEGSSSDIDSVIVCNNKSYSGGGINIIYGYNPIISNTAIYNNHANSSGGGIYSDGYGTYTLLNAKIYNNYSSDEAGAIFCGSGSVFFNNIIYNNHASYCPGIVFANNGCISRIINTIIDGNVSTTESNGVYFYSLPDITYFTNCIISNHSGFGVACTTINVSPHVHMINSLLYHNFSGNFNFNDNWLGHNITVNANSDSCDAYMNIQRDPLFVNLLNHDYRLNTGSPCIDAGLNDSVGYSFDIAGQLRLWDGNNDGDTVVDIGAYEYHGPVETIVTPVTDRNIIFPNPCWDYFNIELDQGDYQLKIINYLGQVELIKPIHSYSYNQVEKIDFKNHSPGIYYILLDNSRHRIVKKLMVL
ncbi:MAG: hypothetical protein NTW49_05230 [Bacteroidia bacterium]|nr:hypothetical protein [Bacteroidia bacterium]